MYKMQNQKQQYYCIFMAISPSSLIRKTLDWSSLRTKILPSFIQTYLYNFSLAASFVLNNRCFLTLVVPYSSLMNSEM